MIFLIERWGLSINSGRPEYFTEYFSHGLRVDAFIVAAD